MYTEAKVLMLVIISLPNGIAAMTTVSAVTDWHAIDQAFNKYSQLQPDRKCYNTDPATLRSN